MEASGTSAPSPGEHLALQTFGSHFVIFKSQTCRSTEIANICSVECFRQSFFDLVIPADSVVYVLHQGGGPGGDQDASCLCRHLRRLWHSRSPTPASLIAKFEHKPLFRNWKGHREYGLSPSLLLKHSKSTGAKCPTTPGAALQSLTKLQARQTTEF